MKIVDEILKNNNFRAISAHRCFSETKIVLHVSLESSLQDCNGQFNDGGYSVGLCAIYPERPECSQPPPAPAPASQPG